MLSVKPIPLSRRVLILFVSLIASFALFRSAVSIALITRGDGFLTRGGPHAALAYYRRALFFDPSSPAAADRFAFAAMMARRPRDLRDGIAVASAGLARLPDDVDLLTDRALLLQLLHEYRAASDDFAHAARRRHDAALFHFAAWDAFHAGRQAQAAALWQAALSADPRFAPARFALARTGLAR
jgi:tetratricopeptide (TPR) repeat protein